MPMYNYHTVMIKAKFSFVMSVGQMLPYFFLQAETDSIDSLEAYRMKSQPTFLFYAVSII